jgi:non-specific serine/threonine protein kinase
VAQTVAAALGLREQLPHPIQALLDTFRRHDLLLVLDNCEHLAQSCAELADTLLRGCPSLRILATSREALGIAGENVFRVPSLSVPALVPPKPVHEIAKSESVRLFVERAQAALPGFAMTERNAAAIVHVCRQLGGIPSAIELAAAWVPVLSMEQIVDRLSDALGPLVSGNRVAPPRQHTLRGTLDWSYRLLTKPEP